MTCLKWRESSDCAQIFDQFVMEHSTEHELANASIFEASPVPCYVCGAQFGLGTMSQDTRYQPDLIFIPQESRGQTIAGFPMSTRLAHFLEDEGIRLFGQLHGLTFPTLTARRNCGLKTVQEIRELVQMVQRGRAPIKTAPAQNMYISSAKRQSCPKVVPPKLVPDLPNFQIVLDHPWKICLAFSAKNQLSTN